MPKEVDYAERIVALKNAIAGMKNPDYTPEQKNRLLKAIITGNIAYLKRKRKRASDWMPPRFFYSTCSASAQPSASR